jgi:enediyne biosynthesis protein E4
MSRPFNILTLSLLGLCVLSYGCGRTETSPDSAGVDDSTSAGPEVTSTSDTVSAPLVAPPDSPTRTSKKQARPDFLNVAHESGIDFQFYTDTVDGRFLLPEIMGGGAAWLDFDLDGELDLYLMNGTCIECQDVSQRPASNQLFRQQARRFSSVTEASFTTDTEYGQGVAVGDFDVDGFPDLYLANYGANRLLHNNGDGTFTDVSLDAGVGCDQWSSSVAWADLDGDRTLDLYVVNYLNVTPENSVLCEYNGQDTAARAAMKRWQITST